MYTIDGIKKCAKPCYEALMPIARILITLERDLVKDEIGLVRKR